MPDTSQTCPFEESTSAWAMGELSGEELSAFEAHMASCGRCASEAKAMRELVRRMRELPAERASRDISAAIMSRIPPEAWAPRTARARRVLALWLGAAAAACLLAALAAVWLLAPSGARVPSVAESPEVERALAWLLSAQEPSGEWNAERWGGQENYTVGLTGLAVLALVSGERGLEPPRAEAVARAVRYLASRQGPGGRIGPPSGGVLYNHGIATVALLEVYGAMRRTSDAEIVSNLGLGVGDLEPAIGKALEHMTAVQSPSGGWGYGVDRSEPANTAVTAWQVHALLLAGSLGWDDALPFAERGLAWLRSMMDAEGSVGYRAPRDFPYGEDALAAMAGLLLLASSRRGGGEGPTGDVALARLAEAIRRSAQAPREDLDYYRSYFLSYALHAAAGGSAAELAAGLRRPLLEAQVRSGPDSGSWEPADRWSLAGGRVYSTAMAALSLQADSRAPRLIASLAAARN